MITVKLQHNPGIQISKTIFGSGSTQNNPFLAKNASFFQENHQKLESIQEVGLH